MAQSGFHSKRGMKGLVTILFWICGAFMQMAYASEQKTFSFEEDARNRPIMAVEVNGVSTTALLDTGATIALLDHAYFEEDCLQGWSEQATKILGIGGQKLYPVTELTDLSVGSRSWSDVRVAVNTGNRFPVDHGILPISLFQTSIVDFEFDKSKVHFYDGRPKRVRRGHANTIKYIDDQRLIFIPIKINGVRGYALVDTGAEKSFVNQAFARRSKGIPDIAESESMQGSDLKRKTAQMHTFRDLRFGDNRIAKFRIPVLATDMFSELGYADEPMMVMGMDLLHHFRLQVDRKRKRITFVHHDRQTGQTAARLERSRIHEIARY